jgi:putative transcriptional regulator
MRRPKEGEHPVRPMTDEEFEALSDEQISAAVAGDPDAAPVLTEAEFDRLVALEEARDLYGVARLRRRLGLGQAQFVNRYKIPYATLREWERGVREPDGPSKLLLAVIAEDPELVARVAEGQTFGPGKPRG